MDDYRGQFTLRAEPRCDRTNFYIRGAIPLAGRSTDRTFGVGELSWPFMAFFQRRIVGIGNLVIRQRELWKSRVLGDFLKVGYATGFELAPCQVITVSLSERIHMCVGLLGSTALSR